MTLDWTKANLIPLHDLAFWNQYREGDSDHRHCYDYSGHGRDIECDLSTPPVLTPNVIAGQPGWYFSGSADPLVWSGSTIIGLKHIFVVASCDDATNFAIDRGLLTGEATYPILVGHNGTNKFYDLSGTYGSYIPRKADVTYTVTTFAGPINSGFAVIELQTSGSGFSLDGIQVGQDRADTTRQWFGYWFEQMGYKVQLNEPERYKMYQYFAMRYWLWQMTAAGKDVFPFFVNKSRSSQFDQETYASTPYSGDPQVLVRGNFKGSYSLPYTNRRQEEYLAAEQFVKTHKMPTHSIYRDYRFLPYRDREGYITSGIREQGSDVAMRFNYSFDFSELV